MTPLLLTLASRGTGSPGPRPRPAPRPAEKVSAPACGWAPGLPPHAVLKAEVARCERLRDVTAFLAGNGLIDRRLWWHAYEVELSLAPWRHARDCGTMPAGGLSILP